MHHFENSDRYHCFDESSAATLKGVEGQDLLHELLKDLRKGDRTPAGENRKSETIRNEFPDLMISNTAPGSNFQQEKSGAIDTKAGKECPADGQKHESPAKPDRAKNELQQAKDGTTKTGLPPTGTTQEMQNKAASQERAEKPAARQHAAPTDHRAEALKLGKNYRKQMVPEKHRTTIIAEALRLAGHRATDAEVKYARSLVSLESSFDAGRTNNWDSNALAGHPSRGFAQVIDSTFRYYRVPGHADIWNPIDNLAAGIRYADAAYGHLDRDHNGLRWVSINRSRRGLGY